MKCVKELSITIAADEPPEPGEIKAAFEVIRTPCVNGYTPETVTIINHSTGPIATYHWIIKVYHYIGGIFPGPIISTNNYYTENPPAYVISTKWTEPLGTIITLTVSNADGSMSDSTGQMIQPFVADTVLASVAHTGTLIGDVAMVYTGLDEWGAVGAYFETPPWVTYYGEGPPDVTAQANWVCNLHLSMTEELPYRFTAVLQSQRGYRNSSGYWFFTGFWVTRWQCLYTKRECDSPIGVYDLTSSGMVPQSDGLNILDIMTITPQASITVT